MLKKLFLFLFLSFLFLPVLAQGANGDYRLLKKAVVEIICKQPGATTGIGGSGIIVSSDGKIITNAHVIGGNNFNEYSCYGGFITDINSFEPDFYFNIDFFYIDNVMDIALGEIDYQLDGQAGYLQSSDILSEYDYLNLEFQTAKNMALWVLGYPGVTEGSLNITEGELLFKELLSGYNYLFTDAVAFEGNSGGAAVDNQDNLLGLVTSIEGDSQITDILDIDFFYKKRNELLNKDILNSNEQRALSFINEVLDINNALVEEEELYPDEQGRCMDNAIRVDEYRCQCIEGYLLYNNECISYDQACKNWYGEASYFEDFHYFSDGSINLTCGCKEGFAFNDERTACILIYDSVNYDLALAQRVAGKLLLQVEDRGKIWYVDTENFKRYRVTPDTALNIFRSLSLGISNNDLSQLNFNLDFLSDSKDSDNDGFSDQEEMKNGYNLFGSGKYNIDWPMTQRLAGKLLLQVEDRGRIWYVEPETLQVYEVTRENLMSLFRSLSLGISNYDLEQIEIGK